MSESIAIGLKRAVVTLADELDYVRAAEKLGVTSKELRRQIFALEMQLCLQIFEPRQKKVELTDDGQFLIKAFRDAIAVHDKNAGLGINDTCK